MNKWMYCSLQAVYYLDHNFPLAKQRIVSDLPDV